MRQGTHRRCQIARSSVNCLESKDTTAPHLPCNELDTAYVDAIREAWGLSHTKIALVDGGAAGARGVRPGWLPQAVAVPLHAPHLGGGDGLGIHEMHPPAYYTACCRDDDAQGSRYTAVLHAYAQCRLLTRRSPIH